MNNAVCWSFQSGRLWSSEQNEDSWINYRDIEMQLIEEAYQKGQREVLLDKYRLDLKEFLQYNQFNVSKQRPIRRVSGEHRQECLREERFFSPPLLSSSSSPSYGKASAWCPFLTQWLKTSAGKRALLNFPSCIDACIKGIRLEADQHKSNSESEARWMIERLEACRNAARRDISRVCIHLYTRESFLYHVLNEALRLADLTKLETLGPLCYLIRDYSRTCEEFVGTVYRGVQLPSSAIQSYREARGTWHSWPSYTSTSKSRQMAEFRGNTLFIIEISPMKFSCIRAYDIAGLSQFPTEEEVLLPAGISFEILRVEHDLQTGKDIIEIKI